MSRFMTGALLGLVAGLLLAPEKGAETREQIADTAGKLKHKWDKLLGNTGMELEDLKTVFQQEISGLTDDVRSRILTILEESKSTASNIRRQMSDGVA